MQKFIIVICSGVVLGIALRSLLPIGLSFVGMLTTITLGLLLLLLWHRHAVYGVLACIFLLSVAVGIMRMHYAIPYTIPLQYVGSEINFKGRIVTEPDIRDGYTNLTIDTPTLTHRVLVRVSTFSTFHYKDSVQVTGVLELPKNFTGNTGRVFNYRGYLAKDDVYYMVRTTDVKILKSVSSFRGVLLEAKLKYLTVLKKLLPEPYAALAGGITVGERRSLGNELTQKFRNAGLIHIVVLSGYNISIIIIALMYILSFLPKRVGAVASILSIVVFTLIVGASATVVRAALMGTIGALGIFFRRSYNALHALFVVGLVMVLWNPYVVLYDPSFQLSFVATLGLLLGAPLLVQKMRFIPEQFGIRELTAVTLATQIAVLPILIYMMGVVSLVAVPVNLLALPAIPLAMLLVFMTGVSGMLVPFIALPFAFGAEVFLSYVTHVVTIATSLPFSTFVVPNVSFVWVIVAYVVIGVYLYKKKRPTS